MFRKTMFRKMMLRKAMKQASVLAFAVLLSANTLALDLSDAKSQGLIGELGNGYLGLIDHKNIEAASLVVDINAKRKSKYKQIAKKNQISVKNIEALMGEKLIKKASASHLVKKGGKWVKP
jgi:hypothetical protein